MSALDPTLIEHWRTWIGRSERRDERIDADVLHRYAVAVGADPDIQHQQPALAHWAYFLHTVGSTEIGPDGHPKRGGFMPPVTLPRRMFAAADIEFVTPLLIGEPASMTLTIADVRHRSGRSGDLILVDVDRVIEQRNVVCVRERQSIVYKAAGDPLPAIVEQPVLVVNPDRLWQPDTVELFRYSAVTFNSHRIHYDRPYAIDEEGYPDLVVHGPYTATKLYAYACARTGTTPRRFSFRGLAPLFVSQPVRLTQGDGPAEVRAIRCDQAVAMSATIEV